MMNNVISLSNERDNRKKDIAIKAIIRAREELVDYISDIFINDANNDLLEAWSINEYVNILRSDKYKDIDLSLMLTITLAILTDNVLMEDDDLDFVINATNINRGNVNCLMLLPVVLHELTNQLSVSEVEDQYNTLNDFFKLLQTTTSYRDIMKFISAILPSGNNHILIHYLYVTQTLVAIGGAVDDYTLIEDSNLNNTLWGVTPEIMNPYINQLINGSLI